MRKTIVTAALISGLAVSVHAAPFSAGLGVSTLGIGANAGYKTTIPSKFALQGIISSTANQ